MQGNETQRAIREHGEPRRTPPRRGFGRKELAKTLAWASLALGAAQLAAPRRMARWVGGRGSQAEQRAMRLVGARELATGIALMAHRQPRDVLWTRVAGDAMDLALLGTILRGQGASRARASLAALGVVGLTALDVAGGRRPHAGLLSTRSAPVEAKQSITVNRSPIDVYRLWRDFEQLPRFMRHVAAVEVLDDRRSRWEVEAPGGTAVSWEAELIEDREGERIAWRSVEGADVDNQGMVSFHRAPGDRGTEVRVELTYHAPGGRKAVNLARLFRRAPDQQLRDELRAMKQVLETGDVVVSDASLVSGSRPARPSSQARRKS
jgi:uncharacterized membrane protein